MFFHIHGNQHFPSTPPSERQLTCQEICKHDHANRASEGWPFTLRGGCGAELLKLPQWFLLRWLAIFFEKCDAEIGHLPGGFKCEFGGGSRVQKKSVSMRKLNLRELNAENCVN